jgi:hypothetical protein
MSLSDGLVGLWSPFLGSSGYRLLDRSGRGNHGTLTHRGAGTFPRWDGSAIFGKSGNTLVFDGVSNGSCVETPLQLLDYVTLSGWIKVNAGVGSAFLIQGRNGFSLSAWSGPNELLGFAFYDGSWRRTTVTTDIRGDGKWHHIAGTFDGINLRYYLDGVNENSSTVAQSVLPKNTGLTFIGCDAADNAHLAGSIAEACIHNRALSSSEIRQLYVSGPGWYTRRSPKTYGFVPAAAGVTGDLSATLASLTLVSAGTVAAGASGTVSATLGSLSLVSSGTVAAGASGDTSVTLAAVTVSSTGTVSAGATGTLASTLGAVTLTSSGTVAAGATGTLTSTLADVTLSATGAEASTATGSVSATLGAVTLSATGTVTDGATGSVSATLAAVAVSSTGTVAAGASGSVSATLGSLSLASGGSLSAGLTAQVNAALEACVVSSTGTVAAGTTGALSVQLASVSLLSQGTFVLPGGFRLKAGTWKDATAFIKVGDWKQATPYVKVGGVWKQ